MTVPVPAINTWAVFSLKASAPAPRLVTTGASLTAVTVTCLVAGALVPPSPSVTTNRTVRAVVEGSFDTLRYVTLRSNAWTAVGVALVLKVITSGVVPVPPANIPIVVPAYVTLAPDTPICPAAVPWLRISNRSSARPPAEKSTVSLPVDRFAESASVTVPVAVTGVAAAFSV